MDLAFFLLIVCGVKELMLLKIPQILCHYQVQEKLNYGKIVEIGFVWLRQVQ
jgi:hypothetical protein